MQKKSGILAGVLFLLLMLIGFASAQFYGSFSLSNLLNSVDESWIILGAIFLITVVLVSYALGNVFKGNKSVSGSIAVAVGLLVIYGVNRSGFNYTDLFYNFFFFLPTGFIETIWPILVIGLIVICWIRYGPWKGTSIFLIWTGIFLIILSFMGVFYESSGGFGLGLLIFIAGLGMRFFNRIRFAGRKHNPESPDEHWSRWD